MATLAEQVCPGNCNRQVLGMEIVNHLFTWLVLYENLDVSVDELDGQVCFLDKAVDRPDVKSNIAQRYCAVHRKLNAIQGQKQKQINNFFSFFGCTWSSDMVSSRNVPKYLLMR